MILTLAPSLTQPVPTTPLPTLNTAELSRFHCTLVVTRTPDNMFAVSRTSLQGGGNLQEPVPRPHVVLRAAPLPDDALLILLWANDFSNTWTNQLHRAATTRLPRALDTPAS